MISVFRVLSTPHMGSKMLFLKSIYNQIFLCNSYRQFRFGIKIRFLQHIFELMDIILLEALSNCVRHAGASELYVKCSSGEQEWIMVITDNGQTTEKDVKEGGGLSGIRKRVEQCGGTLRICAESKFSIIVKIPKEVRR